MDNDEKLTRLKTFLKLSLPPDLDVQLRVGGDWEIMHSSLDAIYSENRIREAVRPYMVQIGSYVSNDEDQRIDCVEIFDQLYRMELDYIIPALWYDTDTEDDGNITVMFWFFPIDLEPYYFRILNK